MSAKYLVIVESPAKIKTISKFLGQDYILKASYGHVRDLPSKKLGIDVENNFDPSYEVMADKKAVIQDLKKIVKTVSCVYIATDPDREGEAIAWHLYHALGLNKDNVRRVVFNEITKSAVTQAFDKERDIDADLVNAQQARRVLDRLVGFEVSPVLWKKVKTGLSAGRVQSVAVRLIVEREKEIQAFETNPVFKIKGIFHTSQNSELVGIVEQDFANYEDALKFVQSCQPALFKVQDVSKKDAKRSPSAPFTTSSLQQEASRKCRFSVSKTMQVAQKLYEAGHITYMRTDSTTLSDDAVAAAKTHIISQYGSKYSKPNKYQTKNKNAQEAHEAIRPSQFSVLSAGANADEKRLYQLIYQRTIASQMSVAKLEKTRVLIAADAVSYPFIAKGEVIVFDGFLKAYDVADLDEAESEKKGFLPPLQVGDVLDVSEIEARQKYARPPARYTEASLVKKLEELGIGRPSTYAPTISTIQKRGYVNWSSLEGKKRDIQVILLQNKEIIEKQIEETFGADKGKLFPSDIGTVVSKFLLQHVQTIMDYHFTADIESQLDDIAQGSMKWQEMIQSFYNPFHQLVTKTISDAEREVGDRHLGTDPKTGDPVIVRLGRFGPIAQIGKATEDTKPRYASLLTDQSIETITLEQALNLFKLPRQLGEYEGHVVTAAIGRFGPYVKYSSNFVSIKEHDPMTITLEDAITYIKEAAERKKQAVIHEFMDNDVPVNVLNGRYGPYIAVGSKKKKNYKIPKDVDPKSLTLEECLKLIKPSPKKGSKK